MTNGRAVSEDDLHAYVQLRKVASISVSDID
jgi:hypothetical protein